MSDIVNELRSPTTGWSGDASCVGAEDAERGAAEIERLRATVLSLLEMPASCVKDEEVIENVNRRKIAMDLIGAHRVLRGNSAVKQHGGKMSVEKGYVGGYDERRDRPQSATHDLRRAVRDYISECDNPVPDYNHRRSLRNRLRELAGCPPEPPPRSR